MPFGCGRVTAGCGLGGRVTVPRSRAHAGPVARAAEAELAPGQADRRCPSQPIERRAVAQHEPRLPVHEIVRALIRREGSPVPGSEVLEELDAGALGGPETRDPEVRTTDRV